MADNFTERVEHVLCTASWLQHMNKILHMNSQASVVGHKYGVLRWSKTGKKTIEGTAAGITSVLASCSILLPLMASTGYILSQHWLSLVVAVTVTGLLEAYTTQLDNAFIPLVFYSLLCL